MSSQIPDHFVKQFDDNYAYFVQQDIDQCSAKMLAQLQEFLHQEQTDTDNLIVSITSSVSYLGKLHRLLHQLDTISGETNE